MPGTSHAQILVVDDEPEVRFLLESVLTDHGYSVLTTSNGREALNAMEEQLPALVLLDLHMPVLGGWETLAGIRARQWSVPVVFLSGGINAAIQATAHNADGYLAKPFNFDIVVETVGSFLPADARLEVVRARVAIVGFGDELARQIEDTVRDSGCIPLTTQADWVQESLAGLRAFLDRNHVAVLIYNVRPPYTEHWALFAAVRAAEHSMGTGRHLVALTDDKRALQDLVGPTPALPVDSERFDAEAILQNLREVAVI